MQWKNKSKTANLHRWDQRQPLRGSDIWTEQAGGTVVIQAEKTTCKAGSEREQTVFRN